MSETDILKHRLHNNIHETICYLNTLDSLLEKDSESIARENIKMRLEIDDLKKENAEYLQKYLEMYNTYEYLLEENCVFEQDLDNIRRINELQTRLISAYNEVFHIIYDVFPNITSYLSGPMDETWLNRSIGEICRITQKLKDYGED